jgi:hypothetical protein
MAFTEGPDNEVILDNGAEISLINANLLTNIQ